MDLMTELILHFDFPMTLRISSHGLFAGHAKCQLMFVIS